VITLICPSSFCFSSFYPSTFPLFALSAHFDMNTEIKTPYVSETIVEVIIAKWLKKDGEAIKANEAICEIETDKASMKLYAEQSGTLQIMAKEGENVAVGKVIAYVQESPQKLVRFDWAIKKLLRNKANFGRGLFE
jgi:nicotinate-nucleotide pyrophosphorylase